MMRWDDRRAQVEGRQGFTLVELLVGAAILGFAIVTLLGSFLGQLALNEHARYVAWAANDASRVMEELRLRNAGGGCSTPSTDPPAGFASWDAWLADTGATGGGGKSIQAANELVVVSTPPGTDPLTVSVSVCWRHRNRTVGECTWDGAALSANPGAGGDPTVTESPAMFSTAITCRL